MCEEGLKYGCYWNKGDDLKARKILGLRLMKDKDFVIKNPDSTEVSEGEE
jgi:hypothetical protein